MTLLVITDDSHRWPVSRASQHCIPRLMFWLDIIPVMGTSTLYLKRGERDCIRSMLRLRRVLSAAVKKTQHTYAMMLCTIDYVSLWIACGDIRFARSVLNSVEQKAYVEYDTEKGGKL